jgi:hypothetical protein
MEFRNYVPEFDSQQCNARTCAFKVSDPWGLGRERKYYDDDMDKQMRAKFIQKRKENEWFKKTSRMLFYKEEDLSYYPIDGEVQRLFKIFLFQGLALYMVEID